MSIYVGHDIMTIGQKGSFYLCKVSQDQIVRRIDRWHSWCLDMQTTKNFLQVSSDKANEDRGG